MFFKVNKLFAYLALSILCIFNSISLTNGNCLIHLSKDPFLRPNIFLKIGSQKINLVIKDSDNEIILHNNQQIEVQCSTKFESSYIDETRNQYNIECRDDRIFLNSNSYHDITLECSSLKWNLYETTYNFVWCPTNVTSYILARPKLDSNKNYEYLAGVCYDTHQLSFKSLYYTITPKHNKNLYPIALSNFYTPSLEVKYLKETFTMKRINENDYDNKDIQDWIKYSQYNYTTIIQNSILQKEFNHELGSLLELAWWPNLRLGNWKRYERALTTHIEGDQKTYNVLAGVSAVAAAPIIETCKTNYTLKDLIDYRNHEIPLYIWNYLRSSTNTSDEIVIIAFNSPFYEFYSEKDVIFCKDKCHEISWLKNVSSTFRYNALGIMFCCSVDDVKNSKRLNGFPQIDIESKNYEEQTTTMKPDTDHIHYDDDD